MYFMSISHSIDTKENTGFLTVFIVLYLLLFKISTRMFTTCLLILFTFKSQAQQIIEHQGLPTDCWPHVHFSVEEGENHSAV